MGDWLIRHMAGSEIPADIGTKVLASERFNLLKKAMGMFLEKQKQFWEKQKTVLKEGETVLRKDGKVLRDGEKKEKEVTQEISDGRVEMTRTALKALILFAKLVQAKGAENEMQVWIEESVLPLTSFARPESGWAFFIIIVMVFCFGLLIGAVAMWFAVYPFFHRVTLVESRSNVVPRPSFLMHPFAREQRGKEVKLRNQGTPSMHLPLRRDLQLLLDLRALWRAMLLLLDLRALWRAMLLLLDLRALWRAMLLLLGSSSAVASDAAAAGSLSAVVSAAASERGNRTSNPRRRNVPRIPEIPLYVSQMGQKFHGDPNCRGLRKARSIQQCARCPDCFPNQTRPNVNVYGLGSGSMLHGDPSHVSPGEVKEFGPCAVCMYGWSVVSRSFDLTGQKKGLSPEIIL